MKNLLYLFFAVIAFVSCSKDDNCDNTSLSTTILGDWSVSALGQNLGSVEFKADGTLIDEEDLLGGGELNGEPLTEKTYEITDDDLLIVTSSTADGNGHFSLEYGVTSFSCDEIILDFGGLEARLRG